MQLHELLWLHPLELGHYCFQWLLDEDCIESILIANCIENVELEQS
jgi:hypothetical protein